MDFFSSQSFCACGVVIFIIVYVFNHLRKPIYRYKKGCDDGTTCFVFICKKAIVMAADGLSSKYNEETKQFEPIDEDVLRVFSVHHESKTFRVMATYAGNNIMGKELLSHLREQTKLKGEQKLTAWDYAGIAHNFFKKVGAEKEPGLVGAIMFATYEKNKKGQWTPSVTYADKGGFTYVEERHCIGTGGMDALMSIGMQYRYNMTPRQMVKLAKNALLNSARYKGCTGGLTNIVVLTRDGVTIEPRVHIHDLAANANIELVCKRKVQDGNEAERG